MGTYLKTTRYFLYYKPLFVSPSPHPPPFVMRKGLKKILYTGRDGKGGMIFGLGN
jgi:hypothetical protein